MNWTKINLPYGPIYNNESPWEEMDSFSMRKLNVPGTLIQMKSGEQYLIGHINPNRGVCDDCVMFHTTDVVEQYKIVFTQEEKNEIC